MELLKALASYYQEHTRSNPLYHRIAEHDRSNEEKTFFEELIAEDCQFDNVIENE